MVVGVSLIRRPRRVDCFNVTTLTVVEFVAPRHCRERINSRMRETDRFTSRISKWNPGLDSSPSSALGSVAQSH